MKKAKALLLGIVASVLLLSAAAAAAENWICPICGQEITIDYCLNCKIQNPNLIRCPECGTAYPKDTELAYCDYCGTKLRKNGKGSSEDIEAGDTVTFGTYPQTAAGKDKTPIEWTVLEVRDGKAFLISAHGLHMKVYNSKKKKVTWATCSLRKWLNGDFLKKAFTKEEQEMILVTTVDNSKSQGQSSWKTNGGKNTKDRIYLLSVKEAKQYFNVKLKNKKNFSPRIRPTAYAVQKTNAFASKRYFTKDGIAATWWWLRSPGTAQNKAAFVDSSGELLSNEVNFGHPCIRPVLWVKLEALD